MKEDGEEKRIEKRENEKGGMKEAERARKAKEPLARCIVDCI